MLAKNDVAKVYETLLSIPGMNAEVKVVLKISRKNLLLLSKIIERGLKGKETDDLSINILESIGKEELSELSDLSKVLLEKGGLLAMNEKLKSF